MVVHVVVMAGKWCAPDNSRPAVARDMRLLVVDFPTAEADTVLLCLSRLTLAGRRMDRETLDTCGGIVIIDFV